MTRIIKHISVLVLLFLCYAASAQLKDVKWTEPQGHPCFYGLKISVLNMGYQKDPNSYLWGIRITNHYRKTVTLRYKLIVGGEGQAGNGGVIWKLKPDDTWTDGGDVFTGNMFKTPASDWKVAIWQVCFDGVNCGGANECYADCDRIQGNENQPCDAKDGQPVPQKPPAEMSGTATVPGATNTSGGYNGQYTKWEQEGKDVVMSIGITETGIFWKEKEGQSPAFFKNIKPGVFRYDKGDDFMIVRLESEDRLSLWNNGSLVGYFKNPAMAKKPEPKKDETVKIKSEEKKTETGKSGAGMTGNTEVTKWKFDVNGDCNFLYAKVEYLARVPEGLYLTLGWTSIKGSWESRIKNREIEFSPLYKKISSNVYSDKEARIKNAMDTYHSSYISEYNRITFENDRRLKHEIIYLTNGIEKPGLTKCGELVETVTGKTDISASEATCVPGMSRRWSIDNNFGRYVVKANCQGDIITLNIDQHPESIGQHHSLSTGLIIKGRRVKDYYDTYDKRYLPAWEMDSNPFAIKGSGMNDKDRLLVFKKDAKDPNRDGLYLIYDLTSPGNHSIYFYVWW